MMAAISVSVMDKQTARPVWETAKDALQFGQDGHGSGFSLLKNRMLMSGSMARFPAITAKPMPKQNNV